MGVQYLFEQLSEKSQSYGLVYIEGILHLQIKQYYKITTLNFALAFLRDGREASIQPGEGLVIIYIVIINKTSFLHRLASFYCANQSSVRTNKQNTEFNNSFVRTDANWFGENVFLKVLMCFPLLSEDILPRHLNKFR